MYGVFALVATCALAAPKTFAYSRCHLHCKREACEEIGVDITKERFCMTNWGEWEDGLTAIGGKRHGEESATIIGPNKEQWGML